MDDVHLLLQQRRYSEALELLLDAYGEKVYKMAVAFLRDGYRAEEVTQDIFLKVWKALPNYDRRASPGTWLYTIARNTCLSALRSEGYRKTIPLDHASEPAAAQGGDFHDVELTHYVKRLSEIQRTVITLFYLQDRSVSQVSQMLGIPEGTVKSHLHRARLALGEMMKEQRHELL